MAERKRVLIVEDEPGVADVVAYRLVRCGLQKDQIVRAAHAVAAMEALDTERFDLALVDQRLPHSERDLQPRDDVGRDLLRFCHRNHPEIPVIVMTAHAGVTAAAISDTPVQLMKLGARDFIRKPFDESPEPLEDKVRAILDAPSAGTPRSVVGDRHELRFTADAAEIDSISVTGEIVPVLRLLRGLFLEDQKAGRPPDEYRRMRGPEIGERLGVDDVAIRRRFLNFRRNLAAAYLKRHGRAIDACAIVENVRRGGYRLNPRTVLLGA